MKSRIYKSLFAIMAVAMVIDWPVSADAQKGKVIQKAGQEIAEHSGGFLKSCSKSTTKVEQSVNRATHSAGQIQSKPGYGPAGVAAGRTINAAARNMNSSNNQSRTCGQCNGTGEVVFDGDIYYCPNCQGSGSVAY